MNRWPEDNVLSTAPKRPPNYWTGFLLTLFLPGSGFAFIHRLWPTLLLAVVGNVVVGPFARLIFGPGVDRWGFSLWLLILAGSLVGYRNTYRAQYVERTAPPPHLSWPLRLTGVWLSALIYVSIRVGYAGGWLPTPSP